MRITLNLGYFFHDHRSVARIFINENIKSIKDLEKRIFKVFHIENFYLKCENYYLPSSEDVNVLNPNDVVWALPIDQSNIVDCKEPGVEKNDAESEPNIKKKKKKKEKTELLVTTDADSSVKPKKRKHNEREVAANSTLDMEDLDHSKSKKRKSKDIKNNLFKDENEKKKGKQQTERKVTKSSPECLSNDSVDTIKKTSIVHNDTPCLKSVKTLVNKFEKKTDFKKMLTELDEQKTINIVKTIIVSNNSNTESTPLPSESSSNEKEISSTKEDCIEQNSDKQIDNIDDSVFANDDNKTVESLDSGYGNSLTKKRKRTRVRKRKRANKTIEFNESTSSVVSNPIPSALSVKTPVSRHVRFNDDDDAEKNNDVEVPTIHQNGYDTDEPPLYQTTKPNQITKVNEPVNYTCKLIPTPLLTKITISRQVGPNGANTDNSTFDHNGYEDEVKPVSNVVSVEKAEETNQLSEEFILKQPIIHKNPRLGDILAFKVLRISENYTPEVSSRIVGKVCDYNPDTTEITVDIIDGREQCIQPKGKFFLENEEGEEIEQATQHVKYQCVWSNLLEPRLLFPKNLSLMMYEENENNLRLASLFEDKQ